MIELATPEIELDKIDVEEGFNARRQMDKGKLEQLAGSVASVGIVQPIVVRAKPDGRYGLVAGHRRLEAAKAKGLRRAPCILNDGNPHLVSLIENFHKEGLNPIDTAWGLQVVKGELNLKTNKELAAKVSKSVEWVSGLLRLLGLPKGVQEHVAAGDVPVEAERLLRDIATVSPRIAECICVLAKRKKIKGRAFVLRFDELFAATAEARFKDGPTMVSTRAFRISEVTGDREKRRELTERIHAAEPHVRLPDPVIRLEAAEVDAARAASCLVERQVNRGGYVSTTAFVTDAELALDLADRAVERLEKEASKRAEEDAAWRARQSETGQGPEDRKEARRSARAEAKAQAAAARVFNEGLGRNQLKGRTAAKRKKNGLARAKAVALVLMADNPELATRGLRLVMPQLQDLEVKVLKSGKQRQKVSYADAAHCRAELTRRVMAARSEGEVLEVMADALVAAIVSDERELPQSKRARYWVPCQNEVEKLLASDIKAVRPRRAAKKRK